MKVVLFGHSYVRDLSRYGSWDRELELVTGEKVPVQFDFRAYPGKDYSFFLDHPEEVKKVQEANPDIVIVVLGGNSVTSSLSNIQIKENAAAIYTLLKAAVNSDCLKIAVQIEARFVPTGNRHGVLEAAEFNWRRQVLNNFTNKNLNPASTG